MHFRQSRHRAFALVYVMVSFVALTGFIALALNWGSAQLSKTQLQRTADAAARYAAMGLSTGVQKAKDNAILAAAENWVDGNAVSLLSSEVLTGNWNTTTRTFSAGASPVNAVKVTVARTSAKGNAVRLPWSAPLVGIPGSIDLTATAISYKSASEGQYGNIIIDGINMSGASKFDSFDSSTGSYASTKSAAATIAGNFGYANFNGQTKIEGSIFYTGNFPNGTVTGTKTKIASLPSTPMPITPSGTPNLGNYNGGNLTLQTGNYFFQNFSANNGTITINASSGPVNLYVNGAFSISGAARFVYTQPTKAENLRVNMVASAGVDLNSNVALYAVIYAPQSPLNMNGSSQLYGSVVVKQASFSGSSGMHYDTSLSKYGSGGSGGGILLVR